MWRNYTEGLERSFKSDVWQTGFAEQFECNTERTKYAGTYRKQRTDGLACQRACAWWLATVCWSVVTLTWFVNARELIWQQSPRSSTSNVTVETLYTLDENHETTVTWVFGRPPPLDRAKPVDLLELTYLFTKHISHQLSIIQLTLFEHYESCLACS